MNNFFTQLKNIARTLRLSQSEKQSMRVQLYNYLEANPMGAVAAPVANVSRPVPSPFFFFSPRYMVPAALLLIVGLGSGTAYAAQGALPGNPLYAIKINVNEAVQTALATTPRAKAEVNAELATNRLEEAETLAVQGSLDATTTALLATNFTEHVKAAQANTQDIEANDPGTAAQLGAQFNGALAAHSAILSQIGQDSKSDDVAKNSNSFAARVSSQEVGGNNSDIAIATETSAEAQPQVLMVATATPSTTNPGARIHTFAAAMPHALVASSTASTSATISAENSAKVRTSSGSNGNPNDAKIAASLSVQASTTIAATKGDFAALSSSLDANTSAQIAAQIAGVDQLYAAASAELAAGNTGDAVRDFTNAVRTAIKLDAYFKAGQKFSWRLLSGLIDLNGSSSSNNSSNNRGGNGNGKQPGFGTSSAQGSVNTGSTSGITATTSSKGSDSSEIDSNNSGSGHGDGENSGGSIDVQMHL